MRHLAGTKTRYRRAQATPLARIISGYAEYTNAVSEESNSRFQNLKSIALGFGNFDNYRTSIRVFCGKPALKPSQK